MRRPLPLVIDTDGGTDDAVAIWWALTDPGVEVVALIATWGNVSRDIAAVNCSRLLTAAGRPDIPIALGAEGPIGATPVPPGAGVAIHGEDGLGGHAASWPVGDVAPIGEPATIFLSRLLAEHPGELALATIGPLSTLAEALQTDAALASRVGELAVMGGVIGGSGNILPMGEVNIANDPEAAAVVVGAGWPSPPLLVGLDATLDALLERRHPWCKLGEGGYAARRASSRACFRDVVAGAKGVPRDDHLLAGSAVSHCPARDR